MLPSVYRLALRLAGGVITEWDISTASPADSAVKGSSPLHAHLSRALGLELARYQGQCAIHIRWDLRMFYDSVRLEVLHRRLAELGYNLPLLYLGFLAHKAPRVLRVGHCLSEIFCCASRSMIAGCQQSVSWARGLLLKLVLAVGYIVLGSPCGVHVDDMSHAVVLDEHGAGVVAKGLQIGL